MALASKAEDGMFGSTRFPTFRVEESRCYAPYLVNYFKTPAGREQLVKISPGSAGRNRVLSLKRIPEIIVPLPPLAEQRRIVLRIEELLAKIEEARGLRQQAVEGAEVLMSRVIDAMFSGECYPEHPLGTLLREKSRNGLSERPNDMPPGTPILRISAGTSRADGIVAEDDYKYLDVSNQKISAYLLQAGDLLACRFNGNLHFVGRFSLFAGTSSAPRLYPDKLIRFRVDTAQVLPEYVRSVMNSPKGRTKIEAFCQTTAGNIGISAGNLNTISIPVPPLSEQRRIVAYLEEIQVKVDAVKRLQADTAAELNAMLPSILDKAFKGALI